MTVECVEIIKSVNAYSFNGQAIKVLVANSAKANIATFNLSKGVYLLKIETENGYKTLSVVK